MLPDQPRVTMHISPKYATTGSDRGAGMVANPTGATAFHRPYLGDEATQTTRTNFPEHTLNRPVSPRGLSVEFKYTLYYIAGGVHIAWNYSKAREIYALSGYVA
jgi:hypothetical protein